MRSNWFKGTRRLVAAGSIIVAACSDGAAAPGREPEIVNATDNFQYQISDIQNFSGTYTYSWQNTGTAATVNQSASISSGTATLTLRDANGLLVYTRSLADNGTFSSTAGAAGTWTIRVAYSGVDATVNFRADKAN